MKYISFLRGINVSGQNKILMDELKSLYESLGFENVLTYIQSGNVIFEAKEKDALALSSGIEEAIARKYAFNVPVVIRTHNELKKILKNCPFGNVDLQKDGSRVLVSFLMSPPSAENMNSLLEYVVAPESLVNHGREIYLYCPNGYGKSKLSNNFIEKKLQRVATSRNWNSILKLHELSSG